MFPVNVPYDHLVGVPVFGLYDLLFVHGLDKPFDVLPARLLYLERSGSGGRVGGEEGLNEERHDFGL